MAEKTLEGVRVAVLAADGFEQVEVTLPIRALEKAGATVELVSLRPGRIRGMNLLSPGRKLKVDRTVFTADPASYGALYLPGGFASPDFLRQSHEALRFVQAFEREGKPIAAMCHGPWLLVSAGLVRGRRLTSWPGIKDDVQNAGGLWENAPVVGDGSWISSRDPHDIPAFERAMVSLFAAHAKRALPQPHRAPLRDLVETARAAARRLRPT